MIDFTELKRETLARHLRKHLQGEVRFDIAGVVLPAGRELEVTKRRKQVARGGHTKIKRAPPLIPP